MSQRYSATKIHYCSCGHTKRVHIGLAFKKWDPDVEDPEENADPWTRKTRRPHPRYVDEGQSRDRGHGACSLCICPQFTWTKTVEEDSS